jgi:NAD(P)-dependent dehydrogenase (short-subunit alcohol dehydrogenase family)
MNAKNEFFGKNIIITGASSGIGQAAAFYFLNCGANVLLAGRDKETLTKCFKKFKNARIALFEMGKDMNLYDFKTTVVEILGKVDILINCAGIKLDGDVEKTFPQDFDYTININLRSVFLLLKLLEKYFVEGASIINMSCLYGTKPMVGVISYAMSKAGLETLTRYAAADFASLGIRINAITACPVETNSLSFIGIKKEEMDKLKEKMEKNIPLGRMARPDDIVKVIIFLASVRSEKITGQIIKVDGGRSLTSSGYVHYKGMLNMNSRFEPDGENIKSWFQNKFNFKEKMVKEITDKNELKKFVDENINKSNFATRLYDAHISINPPYKMVDANEELLKTKYLKGNTPNELLDLKTSKQNKMSYNDGQFPIQIPETKNSLLNNRYTRNTKMENEDNNINNNYDEYGIEKKENNNINNINNFENVGMLEKMITNNK